ncbi:MAG: ABC transporter permease [Candidatus Auribacterota bacterium]|jgi:ABC-type dipeptide/oligopeptide/nickel transport system permease component|nr:ABC transporter permease [Candidatus Auribacterota bacterium]
MPFVYFLRKIMESVPTLIGVTLITFVLLKLAPGDPIYSIIGERVTQDRETMIREQIDISKSAWPKQYVRYISNIFKGDFGSSYVTKQPVIEGFSSRFPNTLRLAGISILLAVFSGIGLGIAGAYVKSPFFEKLLMILTTFGISTPVFWFGLLLIYIFARVLGVLPASGMGDGEVAYIILPAVTLASRSAAYLARMTRTSFDQVKHARFVLAARARGISSQSVVLRHTLKNALIPVITLIGLDFGSYLNGSVLTETIFGWNGVGSYLVTAISQRDYPVIMGGVLLGTVIFIVVNIVMDFLYTLADPRIELK